MFANGGGICEIHENLILYCMPYTVLENWLHVNNHACLYRLHGFHAETAQRPHDNFCLADALMHF